MMPRILLSVATVSIAAIACAQDDITKSGSLIPAVRQQTDFGTSSLQKVHELGTSWDPMRWAISAGLYGKGKNRYTSLALSHWGFRRASSRGSALVPEWSLGVSQDFGVGDDRGSLFEVFGEYLEPVRGVFDRPFFVAPAASFYSTQEAIGYSASLTGYLSVGRKADQTSTGRFVGPDETWAFAAGRSAELSGDDGPAFTSYSLGVKHSFRASSLLRSNASGRLVKGRDDDIFLFTLQQNFGPSSLKIDETAYRLSYGFLRRQASVSIGNSTENRWSIGASLSFNF